MKLWIILSNLHRFMYSYDQCLVGKPFCSDCFWSLLIFFVVVYNQKSLKKDTGIHRVIFYRQKKPNPIHIQCVIWQDISLLFDSFIKGLVWISSPALFLSSVWRSRTEEQRFWTTALFHIMCQDEKLFLLRSINSGRLVLRSGRGIAVLELSKPLSVKNNAVIFSFLTLHDGARHSLTGIERHSVALPTLRN